MTLRKSNKASLRRTYGVFIEVGLAAALLLLILAFQINIQPAPQDFTPPTIELPPVDEVKITKQEIKPPAPPRPATLVTVPDDVILEADTLLIDFIEMDDPLYSEPPEPDPEPAEEAEPDPGIFVIVEQEPELIGDLGELQKQIKYPEMARKAGIEGRVVIQFVVDENGSATQAKVLKGIGGGCDEEALRVVRQAKFKPGKQRGKSVKVRMSLPITFKLR